MLHSAKELGNPSTVLMPFGSSQENKILEAFRVSDGASPYLGVWNEKVPPQLVRSDYAGSTLQRKRTKDAEGRAAFIDDYNPKDPKSKRKQFALRTDAGKQLKDLGVQDVPKIALAAWLARKVNLATASLDGLLEWFNDEFPMAGTDLDVLFTEEIPPTVTTNASFGNRPTTNDEIIAALGVNLLAERKHARGGISPEIVEKLDESDELDDLLWTRDTVMPPLKSANVSSLVARTMSILDTRNVRLPDPENLVRRCVMSLLAGHLVLQGPPGTGKTTLARALGEAFNVELLESTATSEWSPFHVVGGFRPNAEGGLTPVYGKMSETVLRCASLVESDVKRENDSRLEPQAAWLFIDEFNRADIDKAIGPLYTILSSIDAGHLDNTPLDLWFEHDPKYQRLWVPSRFRIVAAMNDLDTSYVNSLSQGLKRRFRFVTVGVVSDRGTSQDPVTDEITATYHNAFRWIQATYPSILKDITEDELWLRFVPAATLLQKLVDTLRSKNGGNGGWPLGTAQVVDVMRMLLLGGADPDTDTITSLDMAVADGIIPQMSSLDLDHAFLIHTALNGLGLKTSAASLSELLLLDRE